MPAFVCPTCQHANPDDARFCNACGGPLPLSCAACGAANPGDARFCNQCGDPLAGAAPAAPGTPNAGRDPRDYTPEHLARRIRTSQSVIEGERRHVTVLFTDVVGFTTLAEPTDPEAVHGIMNRCIEVVLEQVHRYEGTVNQFTGDGAMALFGAPVALEDAPRRAVAASLAIHRALEPLRREVREALGTDFRMRVGVHSGLVVVGRIGDDLRMEYTAVGDTINLAARLQELAAPGSVLISEATRNLVAGFFDLRDRGTTPIRGRREPVRAFEVEGARAARDRIEAAAEVGLSPFVGRSRELDTLWATFEAARSGHGQIAFLVGEAGIGKSRLLYEFRRRLEAEAAGAFTWFEGHCASYGRNTAFGPIVDGLRRQFGMDERDDEPSAIAKLERAERERGGGLEWTLPYLRALLSLPIGDREADEAFRALDASTRRGEIQRALEARFLRAAEQRTLVYVVEDLHWIDPASEEVLGQLADAIPTARVLLVFTHRPGYRHPFGDRSYHVRIALQALSEEEMAELARAVLDVGELPDALRRLIAEKAEGNPFFIEEMTQALLEENALRIQAGRAELTGGGAPVAIPDRIQDILMARLDRLPDEPKRAIQVASVIGREFALRLLGRISDAGERIGPIVEELRALELIYQKSAHPELAYMFKHALTHDVAYESVLLERRKALHGIVGAAIEELYRDRLAEHYEALAHHFGRAERWERALHYHDLAAHKASEAFANHAAAEHCREALRIAAHLGERVDDERRRDWEERLGRANSLVSDCVAAGDAYRRAAGLTVDPQARATNLCRAAYWYFWGHDYERTDATGGEALEVAKEHGLSVPAARARLLAGFVEMVLRGSQGFERAAVGSILKLSEADDEFAAYANHHVGELLEWQGEYPLAIELQERALTLAKRCRLGDLLIQTKWFLGKALCCTGEYGRALGELREALDLADRVGARALKTRVLNTLGWLYAEIGCDAIAADFNERSTALAAEMVKLELVPEAPELYGNAATNLACNWIALGRLDAARDRLDAVGAEMERTRDPWMRWRYSLHHWDAQARLALAAGDPDTARDWVARELEGARRHGARKLEARALELSGRVALALEKSDEADQALTEAMSVAGAIGYHPVCWRADAQLAESARQRGDRGAAHRHAEASRARIHGLAERLTEEVPRGGLLSLVDRMRSGPIR